MLKFVAVASDLRGKGYGRKMISLAVEKAFADEAAEAVQLMVFTENIRVCSRFPQGRLFVQYDFFS